MSQANGIVRADVVRPYGLANGLVRACVWGVFGTAEGHDLALMGWI